MTTKIRQELDQFAALILNRWDALQSAKKAWTTALKDAVNHPSIANCYAVTGTGKRWEQAREDFRRGG